MRKPQRKYKKNATSMRLVGALVGQFRRKAHMTQRALSEHLPIDEETVASIEQGRRNLQPDVAEIMDQVLGTKGALAVAVENLPEVDKYPLYAEEFMRYEREALSVSWFEAVTVPGLLQTERYARAAFTSAVPPFDDEEYEAAVTARLERQAVLHRKPPLVASFVIAQGVLMQQLGGASVLKEQLRHLRACADLTGVSVQIMPFERPLHAGLSGPFVLVETADHQQYAYVEHQRGSQLTDDPATVTALNQRYGMLRTQALNTEETKGLLERMAGEL
ncbi:helix-turn-helix domain-containing protein [Streptomyces sp. NPDC054784]